MPKAPNTGLLGTAQRGEHGLTLQKPGLQPHNALTWGTWSKLLLLSLSFSLNQDDGTFPLTPKGCCED